MPRLSMPPPGTAAGIEAEELSSRTSGPEPVYISVVSNRTNETVKVLTIIGTIFIPLTFLAGVYGMNMPIPENAWWFSYPLFWLTCLAVSGGMLLWFRRRGWL
jgi:magnesium transporter